MKPEPSMQFDDFDFDRLVDGEMSREEYRRFLAGLEKQPDGWRRCALAFLEAQAWRQELGVVRATEPTLAQADVRPQRGGWYPWGARWLAVAASVALAFGVGRWWPERDARSPRSMDATASGRSGAGLGSMAVVAPSGGAESLPRMPVDRGRAIREPAPASPDSRPLGEVELVSVAGDGDFHHSTRLPVQTSDEQSAGNAAQGAEGTRPLAEWLRKLGREVELREGVIPVVLPDGRRVLVPVEHLELTPVRTPAY